MYPSWIVPSFLDPENSKFLHEITRRLGNILNSGDDILITETQLHTAAGLLDHTSSIDGAIESFNFQSVMTWFAENGIGVTWWPPTSRNSALFDKVYGNNWGVFLESTALAHHLWSHGETAATLSGTEHYGTDVADFLVVGLSSDLSHDHVTEGLNPYTKEGEIPSKLGGNYGLLFGLDGDDTLIGSDDNTLAFYAVDMLYGGEGNDSLQGRSGDDWLFGGAGRDTLKGGTGDDVIIDLERASTVYGGGGNDYIQISGGKIYAGDGNDKISFTGSDSLIWGVAGEDIFSPMGNTSADLKDFTVGVDTIDFSFWSDMAHHSNQEGSVYIDLHKNGKGQFTGDVMITNSQEGSLRVFGNYQSPLALDMSNFTHHEGLTFYYAYNATPSNGVFSGTDWNEALRINSPGDYWGGVGRDQFIIKLNATDTNIKDFNKNYDCININGWQEKNTGVIVSKHPAGSWDAISDLIISSSDGQIIRVTDGNDSLSVRDAVNFITCDGVRNIQFEYDAIISGGKFNGLVVNEILHISGTGNFWGGGGFDTFVFFAGVSTGTRIRDFNVSQTGHDTIDLSNWGVSSFNDLVISDQKTGKGDPTGEVYISDGMGSSIRISLTDDDPNTSATMLGASNFAADMFLF